MAGLKYGGGAHQPVFEPLLVFLGGQRIAMTGANANATVPAGTQIVVLSAEGAPLYYSINLGWADNTSMGFVPQNTTVILGPLVNLTTLHFWGTNSTTIAHAIYYRQNTRD